VGIRLGRARLIVEALHLSFSGISLMGIASAVGQKKTPVTLMRYRWTRFGGCILDQAQGPAPPVYVRENYIEKIGQPHAHARIAAAKSAVNKS
jgi:hypothetical protein